MQNRAAGTETRVSTPMRAAWRAPLGSLKHDLEQNRGTALKVPTVPNLTSLAGEVTS
jgi:hypothetical protein